MTELGTPLPCHVETLLSSRLCGPLAISFGERLTAMEMRTDLHAVRIFASQCQIVNPITFTTNNTPGESKSHFRLIIFQKHFQVSHLQLRTWTLGCDQTGYPHHVSILRYTAPFFLCGDLAFSVTERFGAGSQFVITVGI